MSKTVSNPDRQTQNTSYTVLLPIQNILQPMTQTRSPFCLRAQSIRKNVLPLLATQIRPRTPPRRRKPRPPAHASASEEAQAPAPSSSSLSPPRPDPATHPREAPERGEATDRKWPAPSLVRCRVGGHPRPKPMATTGACPRRGTPTPWAPAPVRCPRRGGFVVERGQADHGGEKAEEAEKKKGRDGGSRAARPRRQGRRRSGRRGAVLQRLASAARVRRGEGGAGGHPRR